MRLLDVSMVILLSLSYAISSDAAAQALGHCNAEENSFFSCRIKNSKKVVSICGAKAASSGEKAPAQFWLQYRFGKLGAPELIYPATKSNAAAVFDGEIHRARGIETYLLNFNVDGVLYEIGMDEASKSVAPEDRHFLGARTVDSKGVRIRSFACASNEDISYEEFHDLVFRLSPPN